MSHSTSRGDPETPSGQGGESLSSIRGGRPSEGGETTNPSVSGEPQASSTRDPSQSSDDEPEEFGEFQTPNVRSRSGETQDERLTRELREIDPNVNMDQIVVTT